jgi:two-component system, cell cycle sensor histidine kinase and response regulator CckA
MMGERLQTTRFGTTQLGDSGMEILLVEDNPDDVELALHAFARHELADRVRVARDGQEALDLLFGESGSERVVPKMVLLDLDLPKVDGFEVLRRIRADAVLHAVPVVVFTTSRDERDVIESYNLGVNSYIVKPADFGTFVETMQMRLSLERPLSVLIVEDSESDAELAALELRRNGFDVAFERVDTGPALRAALEAGQRVLVLCDHDLPGLDAREALRIVRETAADTPFVILSGTIGEEAVADALKAGANDVVVKGNLSRIGLVVDRVLLEAEHRRVQREGAAALLESEARKTSILDSALDAVITIDQDGRIIDFNDAAVAMFGYAREDVVRREMAELIIPPSLRQEHTEAFARHLATGESTIIGRRVALTGMRADGSEFPVELSVTRSELSARPFFTAYLRDLTESRQAERERAALESQLVQAQKLEAIGSLAVGITHDFSNFLTVVTGYSEILLRGLEAGDPHRAYVEQILAAGKKGETLTQQVLAFGRKQIPEPKVLDLNAIVSGIEPMLGRLVGEEIELVTRLDTDLGRVEADPGLLEQVIMNLVVNAGDAMPTGGTLAIETGNVEFDQDSLDRPVTVVIGRRRYARLSVSDTGDGMDDETQARVFEPFFTTKAIGKGTGLGLSTVYGIIDQSDGFVSVYSEPAHGTTFNVYLPLVETPSDLQEEPEPERASDRGTETLLLVENDEDLIRLLQVTLEEFGYTVLGARDATEAVELCEGHDGAIHLVIAETVLPGMSGLDLGRELLSRRPELRLLYMSGSANKVVERMRREHIGGFIRKPFSAAALSRKVRALLDSG